ncbi:hypothetical protein GCM10025789_14240 [Tessaracoccus lubricantis]|uniref:Novel STAND NTPase 1 domain-containing protein n=1 Tax=Tessaracoccus lubricantis TaxID=545543 RepID=A0ABP9F9U5_9ACTN
MLAKRVHLSSSTLQGWFEGKHLPTLALQDNFLALARALDLTAEVPEEEWLQVLARLRTQGQVGANPYVGMRAYSAEDSERYFGRQVLLDELVAAVENVQTAPGARLVAVVGVSGSGKSSLLQAGLIGTECHGGRLSRFTCVALPPEELAAWRPPAQGDVLIVADHMESLRSMTPEAAQDAVDALTSLPSNVTCVFGLTADAFGVLSSDNRLRRALTAPVLVGALMRDEFEDIIRQPAIASGRPVDDALVTLILSSLWRYGEPPASVLPMLSNSLRQAWAQATGPTVTVDDYLATGGIWGGLERLAEGIHEAATPQEQLGIRKLLLDLVQVSSDGIERRSVDATHLPEDVVGPAEAYLNARLLTLDGTMLSIGHSALLGRWKRLGTWVDEEREHLLFRRRIAKAAEVWEESNRDPQALIPVEALVFDQFTRTTDIALTPLETDFFDASLAKAEEEKRAHRRQIGQLQRRNAVMTVLALLAAAALLLTFLQMRRADSFAMAAEIAKAEAQSRQLALVAEELHPTDRNLAAQFSLAALRTARTAEAEAAVLKAGGLGAPWRVMGPRGTVRIAASPDGALVARANGAGVVDGWRDGDFSAPAFSFEASSGQLFGIAHGRRDGRELLAVSGQGTASVWDVTGQPELLVERAGAEEAAYGAAFGDHHAYLGFGDGTIAQVDLATMAEVARWDTGEDRPVEGLAAQPGGGLVVAGGDDIQLWDESGAVLPATEAMRRVTRLQFSPDGSSLAAAGSDGQATIFDVSGQTLTAGPQLQFGAVYIHSLAYDGHRVILGTWDGRAGAFAADGTPLGEVAEPASVTGLAWADGRVVTGTLDGTMRVWPQRFSGELVEGSATPLPSALTGQHFVKYFEDHARAYHFDGSEGHRLQFSEDAGTGYGPVLSSGHVLSLPTASGRLASWDTNVHTAQPPVWSQVGTEIAYELFQGPDGLALYAETSQDWARVIRREGLQWHPVGDIQTWSTLAAGWHPTKPLLAAMSTASTELVIHDVSGGQPKAVGQVGVPAEGASIALTWTSDGEGIIVGTDAGLVYRVDVSDPAAPVVDPDVMELSAGVASLSLSPGGGLVAAGLIDGRIYLLETSEEGGFRTDLVLRPGRGAVADIHLDQERVVFATDTQGAYVWPLDVDDVAVQLCDAVGERLTAREWDRMVPGVDQLEPCG